eukprot:2623914-Rhodomonas_salina.1
MAVAHSNNGGGAHSNNGGGTGPRAWSLARQRLTAALRLSGKGPPFSALRARCQACVTHIHTDTQVTHTDTDTQTQTHRHRHRHT